jgi:RNA polymerase sigma factor (sigma-70 family)
MKRKQIEMIDRKDRCGDLSLDIPSSSDHLKVDELKEHGYDESREHPTPEQLLVREATKYLTPKQKRVWALYNFDRLTQEEIGAKLGISQQMVTQHIQAIEKRIAKWVSSNMGAYKLLKGEFE